MSTFAELIERNRVTRSRQRKAVNAVMLSLTGLLTLLALVPLFWIIGYVLIKGGSNINLDFFIHDPRPVGIAGGGVLSAIEGTIVVTILAAIFAIPPGVVAAFYAARYPNTPLGVVLRFSTDVLSGVPSIVIGMFAYTVIVVPMGHYSGLAGGAALAVIMLPIIIRTTEEMLKLVPATLREASLGLGAAEWKTMLSVVFPAASSGILTGFLLGIARASGETAPLLMTTLGNERFDFGQIVRSGIQGHKPVFVILWSIINQPVDSLPLALWKYAQQPNPQTVAQAWAVALVLMLFVLILNVTARVWIESHSRRMKG
ncbi:MAG: phosphate ABC transporter permease PstA [Anaerolineales bacterium]